MDVVLSGFTFGCLYALLGLSLTLIFRLSGVLNFAQGAMATATAYSILQIIHAGVPYGWALVIGIGIGALSGLVGYALVAWPLTGADPIAVVMAAFGLMLASNAAVTIKYSSETQAFPAAFQGNLFHIGGAPVEKEMLFVVVVTILFLVGMYLLMVHSRLGRAMRAVNDNPVASRLMGV
ncbi:MAG: branched-chain amino acid ABC transporter permease, partial [Nocardioidaceae bacterium]